MCDCRHPYFVVEQGPRQISRTASRRDSGKSRSASASRFLAEFNLSFERAWEAKNLDACVLSVELCIEVGSTGLDFGIQLETC